MEITEINHGNAKFRLSVVIQEFFRAIYYTFYYLGTFTFFIIDKLLFIRKITSFFPKIIKFLFSLSKPYLLNLYISKFGNSITAAGVYVRKKMHNNGDILCRKGLNMCRYYSTGLVNHNNNQILHP